MHIKEDFLHYLWKLKKFEFSNLLTTDNERITILDFGIYNTDSGPDFFNAKIKIGDTLWVGNVEIHINSSDWLKHNHNIDSAYNNVILHVVYEHDIRITTRSGNIIPTLELKNRIFKNDLKNYKLLRYNKDWIPCEKMISEVSTMSRISALEKAITDRLTYKSSTINQIFKLKNNDWNEVFYIFLAKYFGMKVNSDAFEMLANSLSYNILLKEKDELLKIEALLFGQAGFLNNDFKDEYPIKLKQEYQHLKAKYNLNPVPVSIWKFSKLRPPNFPTIRIAQLAKVLDNTNNIFRQILESEDINPIKSIFEVKLSDYWINHYIFDKPSKNRQKSLGINAINVLIINTVVPFLFFYGTFNNQLNFNERAIDFLLKLPAENNSIINKWSSLGFKVKSAYDSQALLQLKSNYCDKYKCLECPIGNEIMNKKV